VFDILYRPIWSFFGRLKIGFVYERCINSVFYNEFGQKLLVVEHSICIPEHNFDRSVECGMLGVSLFW
jgi:hypothetical protein